MGSDVKNEGFDSAVNVREKDYLNRWPLGQEIYNIAVSGPREWSVRIGIYGEWGSGKTTVLNFIEIIANQDSHVVVRFNPWQYTTKNDLWQAFVLSVYEKLGKHFENLPGSKKATIKKFLKSVSDESKNIADTISSFQKESGQAMGLGLNLVNRHLNFSKQDLKDFGEILGERRILILVDDLDRVEPKLVPEILFALKEILDIPGYAFICAFDPKIVGIVLGKYHPGFGDGLKFLEKIIDYPRWLMKPSEGEMKALAHADISRYCPYVPLPAFDENISLLPNNPRISRQYIRLLSLLKNQIDRHYEHELIWTIILAANLMKVLYPQFAQKFFENESFWSEIGAFRFSLNKEADERTKKEALIKKYIDIVINSLELTLIPEDEKRIYDIIKHITEKITFRSGGHKAAEYQIKLSEIPGAVTWKEYDQFISQWKSSPTFDKVNEWISGHSSKNGFLEKDVYTALLTAIIMRRNGSLDAISDEKLKSGVKERIKNADELLTLIEQFVFYCGRFNPEIANYDILKSILASLMKNKGLSTKEYEQLKKREESFLIKLTEEWTWDVAPLIKFLKPYNRSPFREETQNELLHDKLRKKVIPIFAKQVLDRFKMSNYYNWLWQEEEYNINARRMFLQVDGPIWKGLRKQAITILSKANSNAEIQINACEILARFDYMFRKESGFEETKAAERLITNKDICKALWNAAMISPLNAYFLVAMSHIQDKAKTLGIELKAPPWFKHDLEELKTRCKDM
jgi:hypothetical protein